jgi:protein-S-isoprenylcysteine O-methyltransferase Ste14
VSILGGVALAGWAIAVMTAAKTHVDPFRPTTAIVSRGPFARTRNPIYVAMAMMYAGGALAFDVAGALLLLPLAIVAMTLLIIRCEERYLEGKFGEEYRNYRDKVRRWI